MGGGREGTGRAGGRGGGERAQFAAPADARTLRGSTLGARHGEARLQLRSALTELLWVMLGVELYQFRKIKSYIPKEISVNDFRIT